MNQKHNKGLLLIAIFKGIKGILLLLLAAGLTHFLHRDIQETLENWINALRLDPDNRFIAPCLAKAGLLGPKQVTQLSVLTFFYSALFLTESVGLFLEKQWAKWFTVFATGSLIPFEVYEIFHRVTPLKVAFLVINIAVLLYLIFQLRKEES